jgi:hypothetical protein
LKSQAGADTVACDCRDSRKNHKRLKDKQESLACA